eukprot:908096_1
MASHIYCIMNPQIKMKSFACSSIVAGMDSERSILNVYQCNANQIVRNIIDKREHKDDPNILCSSKYPVSFNDLPGIMVSTCASYLDLSEVTRLSLCNRHAYISCKSIPTSITSLLNPSWFEKYRFNYGNLQQQESIQIQKLHQFSRVKHLDYFLLLFCFLFCVCVIV